jgi:hypothetical protein
MSHQKDETLIKMILNSVQDGDLEKIKSNIVKYNVNMNSLIDRVNQQNAFFYCALIKDDNDALNICKYLSKIGVNPLFKDKHEQTCLYYTAREGKYLTSKYLIEDCKLPINERDIYGQNPIYYCAREGHLNLCQLLVDKGSDVNLEDKFGQTCIFYAIRQGHYNIVEFLIKNGANINKVDKKRQTPISYASKMNQESIVELLIENGVNKPDRRIKEKAKNNNIHNSKIERKKTTEEIEHNKKIIMNIQVPKKYVLVKINKNGEKIPLTEQEINEFMQKNTEINDLVSNRALLKQLVDEINDDDVKMCDSWEKIARQLMNVLWRVKDAEIFHKPVDHVELNVLNYYDIIKRPMDFSTVKRKLINCSYTNLKEYCEDMDLIFNNCFLYNGINSNVGEICSRVKNEYNKLFIKFKLNKFK